MDMHYNVTSSEDGEKALTSAIKQARVTKLEIMIAKVVTKPNMSADKRKASILNIKGLTELVLEDLGLQVIFETFLSILFR